MENVFAIQLVAARKMAGLSLQELSDKMENMVTKQALNKYEQGKMNPDSNVLIQLAKALGVPVDYFFRTNKVQLHQIEFRKRVKLSKTEEEAIKQKTIDFLERYFELENLLNIKSVFKNPLKNNKIHNLDDIERVAEELRDKWELGRNPIPNVVEMLEDQGIKVFEIEAPESFDGMKAEVDGKPVVVINTTFDMVRKRFTALHELAHLILDFSAFENEKEVEKYCHSFAGAFLIPKKEFEDEFSKTRQHLSLEELIQIKEYYGISIQAIAARAKNLGILDEIAYRNFNIHFSMLGLKKKEPGNYAGKEKAIRFRQLLYRAAAEEVISLSKAAALNNQSLSEFRKSFVVI